MSNVVGSAYVELRARLDRLETDLASAGGAFERVENDAAAAGAEIETEIAAAAALATAELRSIGDAWSSVEGGAAAVGSEIESEFSAAAADAETEIRGIGEGFNGVETDARGAADEIERRLGGAAESAADEIEQAGNEAGQGFSDGFSGPALGGIIAFGTAAGAALVTAFTAVAEQVGAAFNSALSQGNIAAGIEASIGTTPYFAEQIAEEAARLYTDAWGESIDEVAAHIANAQAAIGQFGEFAAEDLADVTERAYMMADVFGTDVDAAIESAGRLFRTGLAEDGIEALDLLAAAMQRVPAGVRDEIFEATNEYSQFFESLGISGEESMALLVKGAENGVIGLDKVGDAIKEFTIRSTDLSTASAAAYEAIGLDQAGFTNLLLAGGDVAASAFEQIIDGLRGIEDPGEQAAAAIALFGTPLEDLGTDSIPEFLDTLAGVETGLLNVEGVGDQLAAATDTWQNQWESLKRRAFQAVVEVIQREVLPAIQRMSDWIRTNWPQIREVLLQVWEGFVTYWQTVVAPVFATVVDVVRGVIAYVVENWPQIQATIQGWIAWLEANALPVVQAVIGWIRGEIESLIAYVQEYWPQIQATIQSTLEAIQVIVEAVVTTIQTIWNNWGTQITAIASAVWENIKVIIQTAIEIVRGVIHTVTSLIRGDWSAAWDGIKAILSASWEAIKSIVETAVTIVRNLLSIAWDLIRTAASAAWDAVEAKIDDVWESIKSTVSNAIGSVRDTLAGIWDSISSKVSDIWDGITSTVSDAVDEVVGFVEGLPGRITAFATSVLEAGRSIGEAIVQGLVDGVVATGSYVGNFATALKDAAVSVLNQVIRKINSALEFTIEVPLAPDIHVNAPDIPLIQLASGGYAPPNRLMLVGEQGPELAWSGRYGTHVMNNDDTTAYLSRRGGFTDSGEERSLVSIQHANFYDGTDAEIVAQRMVMARAARGIAA